MAKNLITTCDWCDTKIGVYSGIHFKLVEGVHCQTKALSNQAGVELDLCDECWKPISKALKHELED